MRVRPISAIIIAALGLVAWGLLSYMANTVAATMFLVFICIVALLLTKPSENIFILLFMVAFFVFLLGKPMMVELTGEDNSFYAVKIPDEVTQHTYFLMTLSMAFVFVGYQIAKYIKSENRISAFRMNISDVMVDRIRYASKLAALVFGGAVFVLNVEKAVFVSAYGYLESYLGRASRFPGFVSLLAELYPTSIAIFLSTLPSKKECKIPIYMYVIVMGLYLLTGKRYEAVAAILLLVLYFVLRNKTDEEPWIQRKHVIGLGLSVPFLMVFLISMESWRAGNAVEASFSQLLMEFFDSVGISSIIISYEDMFHDELAARDVWFSFGNMWRSLNGNAIAQMLGADKVYASQTIENALYGHSLSSAIMYKVNPARMLSGGGLGSCYIAELMCDFSYPGVAIGSAVLGVVMQKCSQFKKGRFLQNFMVVFIAMNMFRVPRDSFDFFFYPLFGVKNIMLFALMYIMANAKSFRIALRK